LTPISSIGRGDRNEGGGGCRTALAREQHAPGDRPPPAAAIATRAAGDLTLSPAAAQLEAGLVKHPVAVHAPGRQLPAIGVERELAVESDPRAALDEATGLAVPADPQRLEPREGEERKAVVQLGDSMSSGEVGSVTSPRRLAEAIFG
jgi:hypothetical protein